MRLYEPGLEFPPLSLELLLPVPCRLHAPRHLIERDSELFLRDRERWKKRDHVAVDPAGNRENATSEERLERRLRTIRRGLARIAAANEFDCAQEARRADLANA